MEVKEYANPFSSSFTFFGLIEVETRNLPSPNVEDHLLRSVSLTSFLYLFYLLIYFKKLNYS